MDRWSRWPEAIPVKDISAATCADALIRGWIARFGVPNNLTSDRGAQFTSALWTELGKTLAIYLYTSYSIAGVGLMENFFIFSNFTSRAISNQLSIIII